MNKLVYILLFYCAFTCAAGARSLDDITSTCLSAVEKGTLEGFSAVFAAYRNQKNPKDAAEERERMKQVLSNIAGMGGTTGVEKISVAHIGSPIVRLRLLDRRPAGYVVWTFWFERSGEEWFVSLISLTSGNPESVFSVFDAIDATASATSKGSDER